MLLFERDQLPIQAGFVRAVCHGAVLRRTSDSLCNAVLALQRKATHPQKAILTAGDSPTRVGHCLQRPVAHMASAGRRQAITFQAPASGNTPHGSRNSRATAARHRRFVPNFQWLTTSGADRPLQYLGLGSRACRAAYWPVASSNGAFRILSVH